MKQVQIQSGKFTSGAILNPDGTATSRNKQGNFTAYDASGDRIFISKQQMESAGFKTDADLKFPMFAIVVTKLINGRNADGTVNTDTPVARLQATSVFKTEEDCINAFTSSTRLAVKAVGSLARVASETGVTLEQVNAFTNASIV